ncbi:MAG: signal recognition particle-docking protein FtsY [Cytophagales bacterium]|nr:signal recognition particle-docking protein FtsY [Cytophagales bacterium]
MKKLDEKDLSNPLEQTRKGFLTRIKRVVIGKTRIDEKLLDHLEAALIASDIDMETTLKLIDSLSSRAQRQSYLNEKELLDWLRESLLNLFSTKPSYFSVKGKPHVILFVGVNGVGKTTSLIKLAYAYQQRGLSVLMGAADTFRAAAVSQLRNWGEKLDIPVIYKEGKADPASVAYESMDRAVKDSLDIVLIDTAGRLHNQSHLMAELAKIRRTLVKHMPEAPQEVLLVIDACTGQNAFQQAKAFAEATPLSGIIVTKLDGTAKGGVLVGIVDQMGIPVQYLGTGEKPQDLQAFHHENFVKSLLQD